jgi:hypothetical protein
MSDSSVQQATTKVATRERDAYLDRSTETKAFSTTRAYRADP